MQTPPRSYYQLQGQLFGSNKRQRLFGPSPPRLQLGAAGGRMPPKKEGKSHNRKKPFKKTGSKRKLKGSLRGTSFSAKYARPLVHRNIYPHPGRFWTQPMGQGLQTFEVLTPERTWGEYGRGLDICQVTSNAIRSRNVTFNVGVKFPGLSLAPQPFQFRVIQAWVKCPIVGLTLASTAGLSGMFDGQVLNFDPDTAWALHAR